MLEWSCLVNGYLIARNGEQMACFDLAANPQLPFPVKPEDEKGLSSFCLRAKRDIPSILLLLHEISF